MVKILYFAFLDGFFIYALIKFFNEMGNYIYLCLAFIAFFSWELIWNIYLEVEDYIVTKQNMKRASQERSDKDVSKEEYIPTTCIYSPDKQIRYITSPNNYMLGKYDFESIKDDLTQLLYYIDDELDDSNFKYNCIIPLLKEAKSNMLITSGEFDKFNNRYKNPFTVIKPIENNMAQQAIDDISWTIVDYYQAETDEEKEEHTNNFSEQIEKAYNNGLISEDDLDSYKKILDVLRQ